MTLFPMFMKLEGRSCLVVGAGTVGEPKISSLIEAGASVRVVALHATAAVAEWARSEAITWEARNFNSADLNGTFLVIAATNSRDLNAAIFREAGQRNILCNVVDDPQFCDFYYPAVVPRGDLQIAISTNGQSPALAQRIRRELEIQFGPEYGKWLKELGQTRQRLFANKIEPEQRRRLLHELASREAFKKLQAAELNTEDSSLEKNFMTGKVYLVGAGPGDPELLTLKALKLLKSADVVLHDDLVSPEILAFIPSSTEVQNVGKRFGQKRIGQSEIHALMVQNALLGLQVVRLKSGDPLIFGRAGEEMEALRKAGIEFEIVPGVTAAFGAAANAKIPLTHRQVSSAVVLVTGHHAATDEFADWPAKIPHDATVVVYMPGYDYRSTAQQLLRAGVPGSTPCAIVSQATSSNEQVHVTTVEDLHTSPRLPSPTLLVVGEVLRLAEPVARSQQFGWPSEFALSGSTLSASQERAE
jgi:uroporphyrin-III C-methyltransferase/precorrin-2 dehydrogenase/sirohydrochlorin ferrochelatase